MSVFFYHKVKVWGRREIDLLSAITRIYWLSCSNTSGISPTDQHYHRPLLFLSVPCLHTPTKPGGAQEQLPFLPEMKGCNVCWGQTSKTMVSHRGGKSQRPEPTEDSFHATVIWSWIELSLFMLHCSTVLDNAAFKYHSESRESTSTRDLFVVQNSRVSADTSGKHQIWRCTVTPIRDTVDFKAGKF